MSNYGKSDDGHSGNWAFRREVHRDKAFEDPAVPSEKLKGTKPLDLISVVKTILAWGLAQPQRCSTRKKTAGVLPNSIVQAIRILCLLTQPRHTHT